MIIIPPIFPFARKRNGASAELPAPLTLVSATYFTSPTHKLVLVFDRAIDASGLNAGSIVVIDGIAGRRYQGTTLSAPVNPETLVLNLFVHNVVIATGVTMSAGSDNGIVAQDDGAAWSGVDGLELPFP